MTETDQARDRYRGDGGLRRKVGGDVQCRLSYNIMCGCVSIEGGWAMRKGQMDATVPMYLHPSILCLDS
jgi:hypothetical protein